MRFVVIWCCLAPIERTSVARQRTHTRLIVQPVCLSAIPQRNSSITTSSIAIWLQHFPSTESRDGLTATRGRRREGAGAGYTQPRSLADWDWGAFLAQGMVSGYRAVNRPLAIYWPDEDVLYKGVLTEYKVASGEHKVTTVPCLNSTHRRGDLSIHPKRGFLAR